MNIIELETPLTTEKYIAPETDDLYPFYITEFGRTFTGTPCYQLRMESPVSCLQYVVSGSGVIICDDRIYTVKKGDTFLLKEGSNQIYYSNPDNDFERIWFNFKGELSSELMRIYGIYDTVIFENTDSSGILTEAVEKLKYINDANEYKNESSLLFHKICQFLSQHNKKNESKITSSNSSDQVEKIRLYIDMRIMENISLEEISEHFSFSKEHIIRLFKKNYSITPHKYIIQSKIRIAMIMLNTNRYSIEEISEKLSFSDPHHFSSQFCKNVGCRPSVYRNRMMNIAKK